MNAPFSAPSVQAECDPILAEAADSLFAAIKSTSAQLDGAKGEALRLIGAGVMAGVIHDDDAEKLIISHRLRPEPYRVPLDVPYTLAFERRLVEEVDLWDKFLIREQLRRGSITRSEAETFFVDLGFDPAVV